MTVFVIGFMATGKSTVGRLVAERLGLAFVDLDELIVRTAGKEVAEIFGSEGEDGFRRREGQALRHACEMTDTLVATGGGAACREENLQAMLEAGRVVALSATPAEVIRRAGRMSGRPMLDGQADAVGVAAALLGDREPFYRRAHHRVDTVGKTPEAVAEEVAALLREERA
jgi:shikimate kinase